MFLEHRLFHSTYTHDLVVLDSETRSCHKLKWRLGCNVSRYVEIDLDIMLASIQGADRKLYVAQRPGHNLEIMKEGRSDEL
jgi:hypothetical protein